MNPILIEPVQSVLNEQYQFLIKREFYVKYGWAKKPGVYFLVWLAILTVLNFLTDSNTFITLKVVLLVLTAIACLVVMIFLAVIAFNWFKRQRWKQKTIKDIIENKRTYWLMFDDSQISFSTDMHNSNIKWAHYKYYKEYGNSIYIFPQKIYEAVACSRSELGSENYDQLKEIVQRKLEILT